jgi:hypothetical protein
MSKTGCGKHFFAVYPLGFSFKIFTNMEPSGKMIEEEKK